MPIETDGEVHGASREVRTASPGVRGASRAVRGAALVVLLTLTGAAMPGAESDRQSRIGESGIGQSQIGQSGIVKSGIVESGRKAYEARKCGTCHMVAGKGNIRFPLDGVGGRLSLADLRRWLTDTAEMEGALPRLPAVRMSEWMATNRRINARDSDALVAYLASLK